MSISNSEINEQMEANCLPSEARHQLNPYREEFTGGTRVVLRRCQSSMLVGCKVAQRHRKIQSPCNQSRRTLKAVLSAVPSPSEQVLLSVPVGSDLQLPSLVIFPSVRLPRRQVQVCVCVFLTLFDMQYKYRCVVNIFF